MISFFHARKPKGPDFFRPDPTIAESHFQVTDHLGDGIFLRSCGGLGVTYELERGIYDEPLTETELAQEFAKLSRFLRDIIPGFPQGSGNTVCQYICSQRQALPQPSFMPTTPAGEIVKREAQFVEELGLVERRHLITILWQLKTSALEALRQGFRASFSNDAQIVVDATFLKKKGFEEALRPIENAAEFPLRRLGPKELLGYVNSVLSRAKAPCTKAPQALHDLRKSLVNEEARSSGLGFEFEGGGNIRSFYLPNLPEHFALGRLKTFIAKLPMTSWDMAWTMSSGATELRIEHFTRLLWFSQGPAYRKHRDDLNSLSEKIGPINPYGKLSLTLTAYDVSSDVETAVTKASVIYLGAPMVMEKRHGPQLVMRSLPMNCSEEENGILGRYTTKSLDTALGFVPVYDGPGGKGIRTWMNNRGFPTRFDLYAGEQNRTTVLLGRMGAGKSVKNGSCILEFMERFPSGIVRVIDKKSSYAKLCDLLGGKLVKFSASEFKRRPYSPFAIEDWDDDDIELVCSFISGAIIQVNPEASLGAEHTEVITEALKICALKQSKDHAWHEKTGGEVHPHFSWEEVKAQLEVAADAKGHRDMAIASELRRWTSSFDKTGSLGFLFCSREEKDKLSSDLRLVVYDLDDIQDERLKNIAAQLVAMKVTRDIKRFDLSVTKLVQFEELGVYLEGDNPRTEEMANRFVMNVTKTIRKMNGIPFGITNAVEDFFAKKGGKSFWKQATQKIFLPFTDDMVSSLEQGIKTGDIKLTRADIDIIRSLHIKDGEYSQAYIISENTGYRGVVNMPLSPAMYALLNTSPSQNARYDKLRKDGLSPSEAIDTLAAEFAEKRKTP